VYVADAVVAPELHDAVAEAHCPPVQDVPVIEFVLHIFVVHMPVLSASVKVMLKRM
jgi:hypothetical protein